jgi:single-stranded-DNA-specific exonuclease
LENLAHGVGRGQRVSAVRLRRRVLAEDLGFGDLAPVLSRIYRGRGLRCLGDVELRLAGLLQPDALGGIALAADRLARAILDDERIVIVGDFDADGATGTALAVWALRQFGARRVEFRVPHRFSDGYGLSVGLAGRIAAEGPGLLVTVDHGVACLNGVRAAVQGGMQVIVTDHHLPGEELPPALAIVNPNLHGDAFPSKALAGVGVIFYLLAALRGRLDALGHFDGRAKPVLAEGLDLVALGTVADLVPLDRNNRILVQAGLERMRRGLARPGLRALLEVAGRDHRRLGATDLGFALGPRLNAAGRLEDMTVGIRCLLAEDLETARMLAGQLDALNAERRALQSDMEEAAELAVNATLTRLGGQLPAGLVVADRDWHAGVVGLVASRLVERFGRPVLALAPVEDQWRGSGRSISGFHLRDALVELDRRAPGLMARFGGHAMAAGFTTLSDCSAQLASVFADVCAGQLGEVPAQPEMETDGSLEPAEISLQLAQALAAAGPFGQGFPEPLFDDEFEVLEQKLVKERHLRLRLRHRAGGPPINGWWFKRAEPLPASPCRLAYQLEVDDYQGLYRPKLIVRALGE